jgi:hypothetical protein
MVRSIGTHHVIDYTDEDFAQGGQRYDILKPDTPGERLSSLSWEMKKPKRVPHFAPVYRKRCSHPVCAPIPSHSAFLVTAYLLIGVIRESEHDS